MGGGCERSAEGQPLSDRNPYIWKQSNWLLVDITKIFTERDIDINSINSKTSKQGIATITIIFGIRSKDELEGLVEKIRQVESVLDVERITG